MAHLRAVCRSVLTVATAISAVCLATEVPAQQKELPRPPGVRVGNVPRGPLDKPQETSVAVNPRDPRQVIVSYHQASEEGSDHHPGVPVRVYVTWSADGGKTWGAATNVAHEKYLRSLDATVTFDLHGHAFLVMLTLDETTSTRRGEYVRRSLDGGRTWSAPIALVERPGEKDTVREHFPNIIADNTPTSPHAGTLYAAWDRNLTDRSGDWSHMTNEMIVVRSTDDGKTWTAPKAISKSPAPVAHTLAVAPDGTLYMVYALIGKEGYDLALNSSRDGGQTFEGLRPIARARSKGPCKGPDFPRACMWPIVDVDARGRVFVVWGDYGSGDADVLAASSDDRGRTWTQPVRVNNDPKSNGKDQLMHWMSVDRTDGSVYVVFYDRRNDPKNLRPTVTLARSTDGGRTFVNYSWEDTLLDPKEASLGDYIGIAAHGGRVYAGWPQNVPDPPGAPPRKVPPPVVDQVLKGYDVMQWPMGLTVIRVGTADFRTAVGANR